MARQRMVSVVFGLAMLSGLCFWPVVLTYTFVAGEKATATVAACETSSSGKNSDTTCTGTWRTESGGTGSGEIYGLDEDQEGDTVPIRLGPMGPYAGGFGHSWPLFLTVVPLVIAPVLIVVMLKRFYGRGRKLAKALLADPGKGLVVVITRDGVTHPDGRPYVSVQKAESPPPGYRRIELPNRPARAHERSLFEAMAGINRDATEFSALLGDAGQPLMFIEIRTNKEQEPEYVLLDTSGTPHVLIRRLSPYPLHYSMLRPGGEPIGSAKPALGKFGGTLLVRDAGGRPVSTGAATGRRWVLRVEEPATPLLRDASLALALVQLRTD